MQSIPVRNLFTIYFESTFGDSLDPHLESNDFFFGLQFGGQSLEMNLYYREDDLASEWVRVPGFKAFKWPKKSQETIVPTDPAMRRFSLRIVEGILHFRKHKYFIGCVGFSSPTSGTPELYSPSFLLLPKIRNTSGKNSDSEDSKQSARSSLPCLIVKSETQNPGIDEPDLFASELSNQSSDMDLAQYRVLSDGDAEVLGNFRALNFYRTSDMRVKFNSQKLREADDPEKVVSELHGIRYKMRGCSDKHFIGYSAQQVQSNIPDAVCSINGLLHVDYTAILPYVSDAVNSHTIKLQMNSRQIDQLCDRVNKMEAIIASANSRAMNLKEEKGMKRVSKTSASISPWVFCFLVLLTILIL